MRQIPSLPRFLSSRSIDSAGASTMFKIRRQVAWVGQPGKVNQFVEEGGVDSMRGYDPILRLSTLLFLKSNCLHPVVCVNGKVARTTSFWLPDPRIAY